jgi:hypothetical protein
MAHHCVHPWQVLATHSPTAGLEGFALRGTNALLNGAAGNMAQPEAKEAPAMPDAMMNVRLVSFMTYSFEPLSMSRSMVCIHKIRCFVTSQDRCKDPEIFCVPSNGH